MFLKYDDLSLGFCVTKRDDECLMGYLKEDASTHQLLLRLATQPTQADIYDPDDGAFEDSPWSLIEMGMEKRLALRWRRGLFCKFSLEEFPLPMRVMAEAAQHRWF